MNRRGFLASLTAAFAARGIVAKTYMPRITRSSPNVYPITGRRVLSVYASNPAALVLSLMRQIGYTDDHLIGFQDAIDFCEKHLIEWRAELPPNATAADVIEAALKSFNSQIWYFDGQVWCSRQNAPVATPMAMAIIGPSGYLKNYSPSARTHDSAR